MKKLKLLLFILPMLPMKGAGQDNAGGPEPVGRTISFHFEPGKNIFALKGNETELRSLYELIDSCRTEITDGRTPLYVDGYCASMPTERENLTTAFIRANRVKSELISNKGLKEANFVTANYPHPYRENKDVVVVTLFIPAKEGSGRQEYPVDTEKAPETPVAAGEESVPPAVPVSPALPEKAPETAAQTTHLPAYSRWSVGLNIGLPFFWGDMTSLSHDKTYIGVTAGIQASYQIAPLLGVSLSLDWARNKGGSREYASDYLLDANGMTWYTPQSVATRRYGDLYSRIDMYSAGLHLDVNVLRLLGPGAANGKFKVLISPAVYLQHFSSGVYAKSDHALYTDARVGKDVSLGLGGDLALRYAVSSVIDIQLKGTGIWITDNGFDNISTVGYAKQNAMWGVSAGVVWKICGQKKPHLMYKGK